MPTAYTITGAVITEVYDGDTVTADIDLGYSVWVRGERLRLARIDAPEVRGADKEAGFAARDFLQDLILDKPLIVETIQEQKDKYGRYIAEIWIDGEDEKEPEAPQHLLLATAVKPHNPIGAQHHCEKRRKAWPDCARS